jgi:hypothetical protein
MDQYAFDEFSVVHFAIGVLTFQAGFSFLTLAIIYSIFKIFSNVSLGMYVIDTYVTPLLGYKLFPESFKNIGSDLGMCFLGWLVGFLALKPEFSQVTSTIVGLITYHMFKNVFNNHIYLTMIALVILGLLFNFIRFMSLGLVVGYLIHTLKISSS